MQFTIYHQIIRPTRLWMLLIIVFGGLACSDEIRTSNDEECGPNEVYHPISGICVDKPADSPPNNDSTSNNSNTTPSSPSDPDAPSDPGNSPDSDDDPQCPSDQPQCEDNPSTQPDTNPGVPDDGSQTGSWVPQDPATASYHGCDASDIQGLVAPRVVINPSANYQLAVEHSVVTSPVHKDSVAIDAHVFEDPQHGYTGFIASLTPPGGESTPSPISDLIANTIQNVPEYAEAVRRASGRHISTHDTHHALAGALIELPEGTTPDSARDTILARLIGAQPDALEHSLTASFNADANGPTAFVYQIVSRSHRQYIIVGAFATLENYEDLNLQTAIRVNDLTHGTALAYATETLVDDCVAYTLNDTDQVDIIISMDASGSMDQVQGALTNFTDEFTQLLDAANVDWRIGVTGVDCDQITSDTGLSSDFLALWTTIPGTMTNPRCDYRIPFSSTGNNGRLIGGDFTTDVQLIKDRIQAVSKTGTEYTLTMGVAAIDRSLPRATNAANKFRSQAAVVLVVVTDEAEQLFKDDLSFIGGTHLTLTQAEQNELTSYTQPWIDYLLRPDIGATVFGLYWPPGEGCSGAHDVAHGIHHVVTHTGGQGGSICQPDITNTMRDVASATSGLASGIRLVGTPLASTIHMKVEDTNSSAQTSLTRSQLDGFDFDAIVNRIILHGEQVPETGAKLIIPYLRWNRSIIPCTTSADCPAEQKYKCVAGQCL